MAEQKTTFEITLTVEGAIYVAPSGGGDGVWLRVVDGHRTLEVELTREECVKLVNIVNAALAGGE